MTAPHSFLPTPSISSAKVGRHTVAGLLAVGSALSVAAGSFFDVARTVFPGGDAFSAVSLWRQTSGDSSGAQSRTLVSGLSMTLSAVLALALGAILLSGRGRQARRIRTGAAVAGGMVAATALDELLSAVDTGRLAEAAHFTFGAGFWLFAVAMVQASAAVVVILTGSGSVGSPPFGDGPQLSDGAMPKQAPRADADSGHEAPVRETAYPLSASVE